MGGEQPKVKLPKVGDQLSTYCLYGGETTQLQMGLESMTQDSNPARTQVGT